MTSLVLPADALKFVIGEDGGSITLDGATLEVNGMSVPVAYDKAVELPEGAIVLVLPTGEPEPAKPAEPPAA